MLTLRLYEYTHVYYRSTQLEVVHGRVFFSCIWPQYHPCTQYSRYTSMMLASFLILEVTYLKYVRIRIQYYVLAIAIARYVNGIVEQIQILRIYTYPTIEFLSTAVYSSALILKAKSCMITAWCHEESSSLSSELMLAWPWTLINVTSIMNILTCKL